MKNFLGSVAIAAILAASPAVAADMPIKAPLYKAPPAPVFSWTGFYVGGNVGYGWGTGKTDVDPLPTPAIFVNLLQQKLDPAARGPLGGGQFGYNWQTGHYVFGAEVDYQASNINSTVVQSPILQNNGTPFPGAGNNLTISQKLDGFGTARLRAGGTFLDTPNLMMFVTGGLAFGHVQGTANTDFRPVGTEQYPASVSNTRVGFAVGGGIEWAFAQHWSLKAEYLHVDLGSASVTANPVPPLPPFQVAYNFHTQVEIARLGVNYMFH